ADRNGWGAPRQHVRTAWLIALVVPQIFAARLAVLHAAPADALADYVNRPDASYAWQQAEQRTVEGLNAIRLDLTSQTWRTNVWRHEVLLVRPSEVRHSDIALLFITGDGPLEKQFGFLRMLAERAGAVAAAINRVPN